MITVSDEKHLHSAIVFPKTLLSKAVWIGGLAALLILVSCQIISSWSGTKVDDHVYWADNSRKLDLVSPVDATDRFPRQSNPSRSILVDSNAAVGDSEDFDGVGFGNSAKSNMNPLTSLESKSVATLSQSDGEANGGVKSRSTDSYHNKSTDSGPQEIAESSLGSSFGSRTIGEMDQQIQFQVVAHNQKGINSTRQPSTNYSSSKVITTSPPLSTNSRQDISLDSECDLYHGKWVYDSRGPLYKNDSCPVLTQTQNCQGNGRPDKDYENWRWKPNNCDLPRFDARKFLDLMRGKTLAFVGDSIARNQMESLLCILWQVEVPKDRGNKRMQRYEFASTSTTIIRIWSAWLVNKTTEKFDPAPDGLDKVHLDLPDESFMELIPQFDVVVVSSGHWFSKKSAYILNNEVVGGQLWCPDKSRKMKINNMKAFGISVETILSAMATHPKYTGLTIVRSFSPDHYEGGAWNTGGSCTGKTQPIGEIVENEWTIKMHNQQVRGFNRAIKKMTNKSRLKLMDITEAFGYRQDGHPGPYRNTDPNKITKRGPDGKPPPQDCLHWCMPGPIDTWNEMLFEVIKRDFNSKHHVSS